MRILYVEDNAMACEYVEKGLRERGFDVSTAPDGPSGYDAAVSAPFDLIILDINLPEMTGFEVLRRLREAGLETPVLFLSARREPGDRIEGLNLGADDYLVKPFAFGELVARIRAVGRRATSASVDGHLQVADLSLDTRRHRVARSEEEIKLTPKEFEILKFLMRHPGQVVSRTMIVEEVWGYGFESYSNLINVHINHLRSKIDSGRTKLIHTVRGLGFVIEDRSGSADAQPQSA